MILSNLKIALRNLQKRKGLTAINILGLSLGLSCFVLLLLYVLNEYSFDRFHKNAESIFRVYQRNNRDQKFETSHPMPLGPAMKQDLREVQNYTRIRDSWKTSFVRYDGHTDQAEISFADAQFFTFFNFQFKKGNGTDALNGLMNIVLTEHTAIRLFGNTDVVGKIVGIKVQDKYESFIVSGIVEDFPSNSSIRFEILGNFEFLTKVTPDGKSQINDWHYSSSQTYIQLRHPSAVNDLQKKLNAFYLRYNRSTEIEAREKGWKDEAPSVSYGLQPLTSIHLDTHLKGAQVPAVDKESIWILLSIATAILLISCINFTTLSIAGSAGRSKEIGIRKVMGGSKSSMVWQFLTESILLTIISGLVSILFIRGLIPFFNQLSERELVFSFKRYPELGIILFFLIPVVGIIAGIYPAVLASSFRSVEVLKSRVKFSGANFFTKTLVTFQFALSIVLIISTVIILRQLSYMKSRNPGFDKENLVVVNAGGTWPKIIFPIFKSTLSSNKNVIGISGSDQTFGQSSYSGTTVELDGRSQKINEFFVETDYLQTMGMQLLTGRDFNPLIASDSVNAIIINEAMMKEFGWTLENAVGKVIEGYRRNFSPVVIGVVKDFNFHSFQKKIEPQMFHRIAPNRSYKYFVRIQPGNPADAIAALRDAWNEAAADMPFRYSFLDEDLNKSYISESRRSSIIGWAGGISIFIACLGLFGLANLATVNRTREIGIRKVLGASVSGIIALLSKDFLKLVILSVLIASPIAWWSMSNWLDDFAFRINIEWWMFAAGGLGTLAIVFVTLGLQSLKAAMENPVKSLRSE